MEGAEPLSEWQVPRCFAVLTGRGFEVVVVAVAVLCGGSATETVDFRQSALATFGVFISIVYISRSVFGVQVSF